MVGTGGSACPPPSPLLRLATLLSLAGHPFVLVPATLLVTTRQWRWAAVIAATTTVPMLVVIARKVRRGEWSDYDVSRHEHRSGLYYAAVPLLILAAVVLYTLDAPRGIMRGLLAGSAMLAVGLAANRWLKVSMHMMFAAFCAVVIVKHFPLAAIAVLAALVAVGWSRRVLNRHTLAEVLVGSVAGAAAGVFAML